MHSTLNAFWLCANGPSATGYIVPVLSCFFSCGNSNDCILQRRLLYCAPDNTSICLTALVWELLSSLSLALTPVGFFAAGCVSSDRNSKAKLLHSIFSKNLMLFCVVQPAGLHQTLRATASTSFQSSQVICRAASPEPAPLFICISKRRLQLWTKAIIWQSRVLHSGARFITLRCPSLTFTYEHDMQSLGLERMEHSKRFEGTSYCRLDNKGNNIEELGSLGPLLIKPILNLGQALCSEHWIWPCSTPEWTEQVVHAAFCMPKLELFCL